MLKLDKTKDLDSIGYYLTDHLRMGGAYWCLNALYLLDVKIPQEDKERITNWVINC